MKKITQKIRNYKCYLIGILVLASLIYGLPSGLSAEDGKSSEGEKEAVDIVPAVIFVFSVIFWAFLIVVIVEAIRNILQRKNWYVSYPNTTKLVDLGQFCFQTKLANNFYMFNFNKIITVERQNNKKKKDIKKSNEQSSAPEISTTQPSTPETSTESTIDKKKTEQGFDMPPSEAEARTNRRYVEVEKIKTPTTVYCNYPKEFVEARDGGIIFIIYRIIPLFKLIKYQIPDYLEVYQKKVKNTKGSKLRYALWKFPFQFVPFIREPYFKWVERNMENGERLKEVPFLQYTIMETKYFNQYKLRFRDAKRPNLKTFEKFSDAVEINEASSEILENIKASASTGSKFLCLSCKECKFFESNLKEFVDYDRLKNDEEYAKNPEVANKIDSFLTKYYKGKESIEKIKTLPLNEKKNEIRNILCSKYDEEYEIKLLGQKAIVPQDEQNALDDKDAREQIMAIHLQKLDEMSQKNKKLSAEWLQLREENIILNSLLEKKIGIKIQELRESIPDLTAYTKMILKTTRMGAQGIDRITDLGSRMLEQESPQSVNNEAKLIEQVKVMSAEKEALLKVLEGCLPKDKFNSIKAALESNNAKAMYFERKQQQ